jgi:hypothetical protein
LLFFREFASFALDVVKINSSDSKFLVKTKENYVKTKENMMDFLTFFELID